MNVIEKIMSFSALQKPKFNVCYGYSIVSTFFDKEEAIKFAKTKSGEKWCVRDDENNIVYPLVNGFHDLQRILTFDFGIGENIKNIINSKNERIR